MIVNLKSSGVIFTDGKVQNYRLNSVEYCFEKKYVRYNANVGGKDVEFQNLNLKVWNSEGCYKNNNEGEQFFIDENGATNMSYYIADSDGEILRVTSNKLMMRYERGKGHIPPKGYRKSREEVIFYDGYEFVDNEGVTHKRGGQGAAMLLKPDQIELVNELKSVIKKLDDAKVRVLFDYVCGAGEMFFFNNDNDQMKSVSFDYDCEGIMVHDINQEHNFKSLIWEFNAENGVTFPIDNL